MADFIKQLLDDIKAVKLIIWGDVMLDHYIWGDANRISPEAPVPVVNVDRDTYVAGGAANVALNVRSLGSKVELFGTLGDDIPGKQIQGILDDKGIDYNESCVNSKVPTIVKTRVIVRNQQLCRLDRESAPADYSMDALVGSDGFEKSLSGAKAIIVSDYAKGVVTDDSVIELCKKAKANGCLVAVDPKPAGKVKFEGIDLMTPNRAESLELAGLKLGIHDDFPAEQVCAEIWKKYKPENLVVTLGAEGMLLSRKGKVDKIIPTVAREVFDVSGAGDTVIAALAAALSTGASLEDSAHLANVAAGIVVGKIGTAVVHPQEILDHATA